MKKGINTPNYPRNYNESKICFWNISTSPGIRIQIKVIDFKLEVSSGCRYDYLQIYDGGSSSANALGPKHCGSTIPIIQISSSNRLYLKWRSDESVHFSGFKISFHSTCKSQLYDNRNSSLHYGESLFSLFVMKYMKLQY